MKKTAKEPTQKVSPEQVSGQEALERMKTFADRKEKFIAAIKTSKDRDIPSGR